MLDHAAEAQPVEDEIMREVRAVREAYTARFGYDVRALMAHAWKRATKAARRW